MTRSGRPAARPAAAVPAVAVLTAAVLTVAVVAVLTPATVASHRTGRSSPTGTVRVLLAGDVMLGRGVASATASDPSAALAGVRDVVGAADLAMANLESPLTLRAHQAGAGPNALEAAPAAAALLAEAGFDALGVANNHAGDAGPATVRDTMSALTASGLTTVGGSTGDGGSDGADAFAARIVTVRAVRIALLAVDATGAGPRAGSGRSGVARWDEPRLRAAVRDARRHADVVVVGLHGGTEYRTDADPGQSARAATLARWGVDVVWGHHPHVVQPVTTIDPDGDGRPTVVATSLGNLLFDQHRPETSAGLVLELVVGGDGVRAVRRGEVGIAAGRATFTRWLDPDAGHDAALLHRSWWQLVTDRLRPAVARPDAATRAVLASRLSPGLLLDAALGDVDGDGAPEVVAAFRRPYRSTEVSRTLPRALLIDARGRSAHVGVYRPATLAQVWVAGSVLEPVGALAACDGWLAVGLTGLDDAVAVTGVGAWRWGGFGFVTHPDLSGPGRPACADVDGDGSLDPLAVERTAR